MKKQAREVYIELTAEVDFSICAFCKYAECYGSYCDGGGELECHHPIGYRLPAYDEDLTPNEDCWGFRPSHPVSLIADIIGIILENKWTSASWWQNKNGVWKVAGTTDTS